MTPALTAALVTAIISALGALTAYLHSASTRRNLQLHLDSCQQLRAPGSPSSPTPQG